MVQALVHWKPLPYNLKYSPKLNTSLPHVAPFQGKMVHTNLMGNYDETIHILHPGCMWTLWHIWSRSHSRRRGRVPWAGSRRRGIGSGWPTTLQRLNLSEGCIQLRLQVLDSRIRILPWIISPEDRLNLFATCIPDICVYSRFPQMWWSVKFHLLFFPINIIKGHILISSCWVCDKI